MNLCYNNFLVYKSETKLIIDDELKLLETKVSSIYLLLYNIFHKI